MTIPLTLEGHYTVTEEIPPRYHLLPEKTTQHVDVEYNKTAIVTLYQGPPMVPAGGKNGATPATPSPALPSRSSTLRPGRPGRSRPATAWWCSMNWPPGGWEVRETAGIEGWIADTDTVQTVAVVAGEESSATIVNKELPGLRITKYERGPL